MKHLDDIKRFYDLLGSIEVKVGGYRYLANCDGRMGWPNRGIYFFMENGEKRSHSGNGLRVVRVGTHAVSDKSKTTLWNRLSTHQGIQKSGGGNHRGSIFRLIVGQALLNLEGSTAYPTWGKGSSAPREITQAEQSLEKRVSDYIRKMPFLWMEVNDPPSVNSLRGYIERNAIALLSNYTNGDFSIDPSSENWLGRHSPKEKICKSGLWNSNHVTEIYDPAFMETLKALIKKL